MASPKSSDWIYEKATLLLKSVFGFSEFRPGQLEAIRSVVHGNDTVVRLTTSAGKSLCYQLPPLIAGSNLCCLVISPLRALMNDQLHRLRQFATCPVMVLTATATKATIDVIAERVGLDHPKVIRGSLNRSNLFFLFMKKKATTEFSLMPIIEDLRQESNDFKKTVIFVRTKESATAIWQMLSKTGLAEIHHSSLTTERRRQSESQLKNSQVSVVVATIGFGMGIDIKDIRLVILYGLPDSIPQMFQVFFIHGV
ncbi:putative ATP-dependent DNA helicase Q1 [Corticium candelabrum]|uniref:putative ATP-dependent DNA helicase Q1 n=1 Tax=Corticium candelabrum TaxID=121492 RepID=UPI002E252F02|nr:putative ATP-dependent DNA helicase Q1 [Corticium candelabrum]